MKKLIPNFRLEYLGSREKCWFFVLFRMFCVTTQTTHQHPKESPPDAQQEDNARFTQLGVFGRKGVREGIDALVIYMYYIQYYSRIVLIPGDINNPMGLKSRSWFKCATS